MIFEDVLQYSIYNLYTLGCVMPTQRVDSPFHANHGVSIKNTSVTKHDNAMFLGAVPCEVPPKPHTMGIKHAVPLGNLDCKDFAGLPVVAVCAMGLCWSPDVLLGLLGLSWFTVTHVFGGHLRLACVVPRARWR